ncbi:MAG: TonB-dependent receptor [Bacteroidaceae bacterium]|nr:TonB-dependent receptor [Bacteroidaceae bacterium]
MRIRTLLLFVASLCGLSLQAETQSEGIKDTTQMSEVVVTGSRSATDIRHLPMTVNTLSRERLLANERTSVLPTVMEEVPGVVVTSRGMLGYGVSTGGSGSINVRGLSSGSGQMLVLIDGHPQYQGIFGHGIADAYQTMIADRVEVLRGPASLLYGSNAMGGVVNIVTRKLEPKEDGKLSQHTTINAGAGSYGTVQVEGSNQLRVGRFTSTVAAQYQRSDNHRPNMGFEQYGGFLSLGYKLSDHWNANAMADITHFNASNPGLITAMKFDNDQSITRGSANLVVENHYDKTSGAVSIYNNYGNHSIDDGYEMGKAPQTDLFRSRDAVAGVSWYQSVMATPTTRITAGVDYQHIYGHAWYQNKETGETVTTGQRKMQSTHAHENEVAGYADVRQEITKYVTLSAGLRYDHHSQAGGEWIPQAGLVVRPIETGEFKFMFSKGFRNPTAKDMYLYKTANSDLRAESMLNYELSWRHRLLEDRLSYGVNLFLIDGDNMIIVPAPMTPMVNTGEFRNMGVEVEAAWKAGNHWRLSTNHSYLHQDNPIVGAPDYKGYIGADCVYGKFSAAAGLQQLVGLYTQTGANSIQEDATLLHISLGYRICPQLKIWAKGENLLAQKYEINLGYPMPKATFMGGVTIDL